MPQQPRLELTWIGKDVRPRLEPRILLEDSEKSCHAAERHSDADIFDNMLIHGDNLLALKALEQDFTGKVKCIYIDPPYNTGSAFEHYDDGVEHSLWLSLMRDRLEILKNLLAEDGSLWVSLDDNEQAYFKVMCDEVFGRNNFVDTIIWQKIYTIKNSAQYFSGMHDYILVYAKIKNKWKRNLLERTQKLNDSYTNPDNDSRGPWTTNAIQARNFYSQGLYEIVGPTGKKFTPPAGTYWRISYDTFRALDADGRIWWGKDGTSAPRIKKFLSEIKNGIVPATLWLHTDVGQNADAKQEIRTLFHEEGIFDTPKPERLIQRILQIATNPGDLVLDSFLGSGTTAAVAHKMGRRWIGIELGDHCYTHCIPRLKKVIDGEDEGGITKAVNWQGGGGFRFYELAPSLIKRDRWGNPVFNPRYNAEMLAEALCKLEGFTYAPNPDVFWQQGYSTEQDFIYVTTQTLDTPMLEYLNDCVGKERSLLVCCGAYVIDKETLAELDRLTVKKIPQAVLDKCEWDHDDYSLNVSNLPQAAPVVPVAEEDASPRRQGRARADSGNSLLQLLPHKGE